MTGKHSPTHTDDVAFVQRRDRALRDLLASVERELHPSTATVYLLTHDKKRLAAAMTIDTPLGFTIIPELPADDPAFGTSAAYHAHGPVVMGPEDVQHLIEQRPALIQYRPFPMLTASWPLCGPSRRLGAVTVRWVPPRAVSRLPLEKMQEVMHEAAGEIEAAAQGQPVTAPLVPVFVPQSVPTTPPDAYGTSAPAIAGSIAGGCGAEASAQHSSSLFQFQRLTSDLTASVRTRDVVVAARSHIMLPFGASSMLLCLWEASRLHVVGSSGVSKPVRKRLEGTWLGDRTPESDVTRSVRPQFFESRQEMRRAYPEAEPYDDGPCAIFPLISNGQAIGCCALVAQHPFPGGYEQLAILVAMLGQVAQALDRTRAYDLEQEMTQSLQNGLLPRRMPPLVEMETAARYLPATVAAQIGGDWYDVIQAPDERVSLVVGDVEGHDLSAVGVMGQLRTAVRAYANEGHPPACVLDRCNRLLCGLDTRRYATCCFMWFDPATGLASVASAGHPFPSIADDSGSPVVLDYPTGPPLGIDPAAVYVGTDVHVPPGGTVAVFSDGLLDARKLGVAAGLKRINRTLAISSHDDLEILADRLVGAGQATARREDDLALLLMRWRGARLGRRGRVAHMFIQRHDLRAVRQLRLFLSDTLHDWRLDSQLEQVQLLASEVVTNSLIHAHSEVDVQLREYTDGIRMEVRDSDPHPPVPTIAYDSLESADEEAESGRGLLIVDALASAWGSSPVGQGKTTWFDVDKNTP